MKKQRLVALISHAMRITFIQTFLALVFTSFTYAMHVDAQGVLDKVVSISRDSAEFKEVLTELKNMTGARFVYSSSTIQPERKVSISQREKRLGEVLESLFRPLDIQYKIIKGRIVLFRTQRPSFDGSPGSTLQLQFAPADIGVRGMVLNAAKEPVIGATVLVKGTSVGTVTDADGRFRLTIPGNGEAILVISAIGYKTQELPWNGNTDLDIAMQEAPNPLNEVIVVGYGTQKRATLTGAISSVKGAEFVKSPQPNLSNSFAGRMPGVIANNRSGEPGSDESSILIRGMATTGNNSPLIVVDGIANALGGLSRLDPNDIESVSVLKDASAAIYGAQAANGVILITTKKGKSGKPKFNYSFNQGFVQPTRLPKFADAPTFATILNEIDYYRNPSGGMNQRYSADEIEKFRNGSDPILYPNTDWVHELIKSSALQSQHNLSVSGGTESINYYASVGIRSQDGLYRDGVNKYNQYNFRTNLEAKVNDRLTVGLQIAGRQEDRVYTASFTAANIFEFLYRTYPTIPARYPNGLLGAGVEQGKNPLAMASLAGQNKAPTTVFNGILRGSYQLPLKGLSLDGFLSVDKTQAFSKDFRQNWIVYQYNKNTQQYDPVKGGPDKPQLYENNDNVSLITANIKLNYTRQFGEHSLNSFIAYEQSETKYESFGASRLNFISYQLPELSQGGAQPTDYGNSGSSSRVARRNYFGRVAYSFRDKYLAEVQARYDGSSIFPAGERYGFFPGISLGWRLSQEPWLKHNRVINDLKLRASYGEVGNDRVSANQFLENFQIQNTVISTGDPAVNAPAIQYSRLANPNITWEKAKKYNIGIDATVFEGLSGSVDIFMDKRTNILSSRSISIPAVSGISSSQIPNENIGEVENKGIEGSLQYVGKINGFTYNIGGNIAYARNKIIFADEAPNTLPYQKYTGLPIGSDLMYRAIGIFRTQHDLDAYPKVSGAQLGDLIYEDYDKDGQITAADRVRTPLSNVPQIVYGVNLGAGWKDFDLSILFQGQARSVQYVMIESGEFSSFIRTWADNRWSPDNPQGSFPRADSRAGTSVNGAYRNTFWLQNTAFLRLKNLELGYTMPQALISRLKLSGVRIYANGFNLLTFTKVKDIDPEGDNSNAYFYPQQKIYNLGINVSF